MPTDLPRWQMQQAMEVIKENLQWCQFRDTKGLEPPSIVVVMKEMLAEAIDIVAIEPTQ